MCEVGQIFLVCVEGLYSCTAKLQAKHTHTHIHRWLRTLSGGRGSGGAQIQENNKEGEGEEGEGADVLEAHVKRKGKDQVGTMMVVPLQANAHLCLAPLPCF